MGYVESLLATNEQIVYRSKKHWIAPLLASTAGTLLTLGGLAALTGTAFIDNNSFFDGLFRWGGLLALVVGLAMLGRSFAMWWAQTYVVTNQKVMKVEGILRRSAGGAGLEKINDITLEQSLLGRMLDYGTLTVLTAADESNLRYRTMQHPAVFRRELLDQKQQFEQADARYIANAVRGGTPLDAPPWADLPGPDEQVSTTPPPPEGAADQSASAALDPAEVPEMIERLAALRDAGALTEAEYVEKKTELLRRL